MNGPHVPRPDTVPGAETAVHKRPDGRRKEEVML